MLKIEIKIQYLGTSPGIPGKVIKYNYKIISGSYS